MAFNIPYISICHAVGNNDRGQNHRQKNSAYGKALPVLGLENILASRTFMKDVVSFCLDEGNDESMTFSPLTPFSTLSSSQIVSTLSEVLKTKPKNYSVCDLNSFYGCIATKLGLENAIFNREYLRDFTKTWSKELLLSKSHREIVTAFESSSSSNRQARHATSIYGEVAMNLNIPNLESNRLQLSRWRKRFPAKVSDNVSNYHGTSRVTIACATKRKKNERKNRPAEKQPPRKRVRRAAVIQEEVNEIPQNLEHCIKEFRIAIHQYPEKVCEICHRLQYTLKSLATSELNHSILQHFDPVPINIHVCDRCHRSAKKTVPSQAFFNDMKQEQVPLQIECLSQAEIQVISQVRPFMKIFYLSKGRGQQAIKGSAIHFPNSIKELCKCLPLPNSSSEFVVVHEEVNGLQNPHDFLVRPSLVLNALEWLKEHNELYKNITICEREEISIQPAIVEATVARASVPQKNIPMTMLTYTSIGQNKRILRASCHQGTAGRFREAGQGKQCTAMSMASIAYSQIQDPSTWTSDTMDEILLRGDKLYHDKATNGQLLTAFEAQGSIHEIFGAISVDLTVDESNPHAYNGQFNRLAVQMTSQVLLLPGALQNLIDSSYDSAIITVGEYSMAILKKESKVYFFDSHSQGPHGRLASNGLACIIEFDNSSAARIISNLIHTNLEPKCVPDSNQRNIMKYLFSIIPVISETDYNREVIEEISHNPSSNSEETAPPIEDRLSNLLQNAEAFGENVMVDSLIHNVDVHVPEIEEIIPNSTSQSTPTIHIEKEKGRPLYLNQEDFLEELSFVNLFPRGTGGVSKPRPYKITHLDYYQARVMSNDTRFWDNAYLFYALSRMEEDRVKKKINVCGQMQTVEHNGQNQTDFPGLTNVHLYMSAIRGSASYWKTYTGDLVSFIAQRGIPTIFLTVSSDDLNSTDSLCGLLICDVMRWDTYKELLSSIRPLIASRNYAEIENKLKILTYEQKSDLLNRHPVQASRHFNHRINSFMALLQKCGKHIFGYDFDDFSYRVEFQNRGSAHIHTIIWLKNAPTDYHSQEGKNLIDRCMTCSIPENDEELKCLVLKYQHTSSY